VASPGSWILALAGGKRCGEIGFGRFLRNPAVTVAGLSEGAAGHVAKRVSGRDVLAIQDTSEVVLGGRKARRRGYGAVGKGGGLGGLLLHPVLVVDAVGGELFGLADVAVWNRDKGKALPRAQRSLGDKESRCWLTGMERAGEVLKQARSITVVSDRESDIYEDFARRPEGVHLLIRAGFNRRLANGAKLFDHADGLEEAERFQVSIPAAPGRPSRPASLVLRFGPVSILRPQHGMPAAVLQMLSATVDLHLVDVREIDAPKGVAPVHWRLLTSHAVSSVGAARKMLDQYRKRWIIEDYFRTLKTAGFQIEDADIADPQVMIKLTALAAIAAVTVTQLLRARDNPSGQGLQDAFDPDDRPVIEALCKDFEGPSPTARQSNPHPRESLAYATWVIARLGGWTGYYGKPGAQTLNRGLQKYHAIKYGTTIARGFV
jgi:hypothetical protein